MVQGHAPSIPSGFQVIHANRLEDLRELVVEVIRQYQLAPLDQEMFLVHSNGIAQWLKLALARDDDDPELAGLGIAAAMTFSLPSRFLWQVYRAVLGSDTVATSSPFDKDNLTWRLFRLLPEVSPQPVYAPLARFLDGAEGDRRLYQLAERIADLFDQYQVYRADWLKQWRSGNDVIPVAGRDDKAVPENQLWQPALWRQLIEDIETNTGDGPDLDHLDASRADIHNAFVQQARLLNAHNRPVGVPKRIIVFGVSSLPQQALEVLRYLGQCSQVLLCVHNPCQFYWADIVEDRHLLKAINKRGKQRGGMPAVLDEHNLHLHAHPLLAAWGKQGRDYIRLLDEYDNQADYHQWFNSIDIFSSPVTNEQSSTLLQQLQDDILNLRPVAESVESKVPVAPDDRSIVFHTAHSPQREVEILHDQLLAAFSADPDLKPQDVIVMVPDINAYAPHIQSVFGQVERSDPRYIPFTVSDQGQRHQLPVLIALEILLSLPESRISVSNVLDLLDISAVRQCFKLSEDDLPQLRDWVQGANIRWGLDGRQRQSLSLPEGMEQNTWHFGLRRMLLGYAVGESEAWQGIEPYPEVGGLESRLAGELYELIRRLENCWQLLSEPQTPNQWATILPDIRAEFFSDLDDEDTLVLSRLDSTVETWLAACESAGLSETPLPLTVVREVWLENIEQGGLSQRFIAGRVNFATLMPMRAIPFSRICLLGMNDGDYPRTQPPMDFDLMAADYRPGDRSRREDDRYLFFEALLSARKQFYISWLGRSINDNTEQPSSVLVAQLQDHLNAIRPLDPDSSGISLVEHLTTEHPLQPFSTRYFTADESGRGSSELFTYANEWRQVHLGDEDGEKALNTETGTDALPDFPDGLVDGPVSLATLIRLLKNPVDTFFRERLGVYMSELDTLDSDDEPFVLSGLENWLLTDELIRQVVHKPATGDLDTHLSAQLDYWVGRQQARGDLPLGGVGQLQKKRLQKDLPELYQRYHDLLSQYPEELDLELYDDVFEIAGQRVHIEDWIGGIRRGPSGDLAIIELKTSGLTTNKNQYRWPHFLEPWVRHLVACQILNAPCNTYLLSKAGDLTLTPLPSAQAREYVSGLILAVLEGLAMPLPVAPNTAFAWLNGQQKNDDKAEADARAAYEEGYQATGESGRSPALRRAYPTFDDLMAGGGFEYWVDVLYRPLWDWVKSNTAAGKGGRA